MQLTVLGAQAWPGAGGENCGYLITQDGYHLQVDAGTGTFARLQQVIGVDEVGAMLITHGHPTISSTSSRRSTRDTTVASATPASRSGRRAGSPTSPRTS